MVEEVLQSWTQVLKEACFINGCGTLSTQRLFELLGLCGFGFLIRMDADQKIGMMLGFPNLYKKVTNNQFSTLSN